MRRIDVPLVTLVTDLPTSPRIAYATDGMNVTYFRDGKEYTVNMFGGGLEEVVAGNPHAESEARIFRNLTIGGWVAMWRPMEIFLYSWWPIRRERQTYDRLAAMSVRIASPMASTRAGSTAPPSTRAAVSIAAA